jgi:hypothetical protein
MSPNLPAKALQSLWTTAVLLCLQYVVATHPVRLMAHLHVRAGMGWVQLALPPVQRGMKLPRQQLAKLMLLLALFGGQSLAPVLR